MVGVRSIPDSTLQHLRSVAEQPDLSGTKYELLHPLGRGGMGVVYLVRDRDLGREVAMKVLATDALSPALQTRMAQEAKFVAQLEHPGIVPIHDVGSLPDGRFYYVMKFVRGSRLDTVATTEPLPSLLRIFLRVCDAVAFAHASGILHRDLKPQNVMIGAFGEVLVMDWGVAKRIRSEEVDGEAQDPDSEQTGDGVIVGTEGFMSPEQQEGSGVDERSDVFALGKMLDFLLDAAGVRDTRHPLRSITGRAAESDRTRRFPNVGALAAEVALYLDGERVRVHPESLLEKAARLALRYRVPLALVAAYLVMRVALFFWFRP
jgi:eukaryotic-like serine/threonine-protein kinase